MRSSSDEALNDIGSTSMWSSLPDKWEQGKQRSHPLQTRHTADTHLASPTRGNQRSILSSYTTHLSSFPPLIRPAPQSQVHLSFRVRAFCKIVSLHAGVEAYPYCWKGKPGYSAFLSLWGRVGSSTDIRSFTHPRGFKRFMSQEYRELAWASWHPQSTYWPCRPSANIPTLLCISQPK